MKRGLLVLGAALLVLIADGIVRFYAQFVRNSAGRAWEVRPMG